MDKAIARAAHLAEPEFGDSWVVSSHLKRDVLVKQSKIFKDGLAGLGKPLPSDFPMLRNIVVAADRETAIRDVGPAIAASYKVFGGLGVADGTAIAKNQQAEFDRLINNRFIIGAPEECAEEIASLMRETGCNRLVTRIQWLSMDHKHVMRTLELIGDKVAPMVDKALA